MNLLQLLLKVMLAKNSISSVSNKTGIKSELVKKLIILAVPMLIKYMTKNASSQSGALSLLGALTQHKNTRSIAEQVDEVDEVDGQKIIGHILGQDQGKVVGELAQETGLQAVDVTRGLGAIAPALLSGLSAATAAASQNSNNGLDLSSLMNTFGASQKDDSFGLDDVLGMFLNVQQMQQQQQQPTSLLGSLFNTQKPQQTPQSALGALFGGQQQTQQTSGLLGTLLGGSQSQQQAQNTIDGTDLLNVLTALMNK